MMKRMKINEHIGYNDILTDEYKYFMIISMTKYIIMIHENDIDDDYAINNYK